MRAETSCCTSVTSCVLQMFHQLTATIPNSSSLLVVSICDLLISKVCDTTTPLVCTHIMASVNSVNGNIPSLKELVQQAQPNLDVYESLYRTIHSNPELSHQESDTAALIVSYLKSLTGDLDIRTNIGGHGLIAILRNGGGKTVLLRADMDALPVAERTNLDYASRKRQVGADGKETPVMHGTYASRALERYINFPLELRLTVPFLWHSLWT